MEGKSESPQVSRPLRVAVVGCAHGELEKIYDSIENVQRKHNITVDVLLCCGDFQAMRSSEDLQGLSCPQKYKRLISFHHYYNGTKRAPVLTIFIGGNHEASGHSFEVRCH